MNHKAKKTVVEAYNIYGVSKTNAVYIANNFWKVPESFSDILSEYYLLSWEKKYFDGVFKEGIIIRNRIAYSVIYYRTDPVKIKNHEGNLLLSFRALDNVYGVHPIVLVTLA